MSSFDDSFSTFIDHYILLLAARFRAPIHTWVPNCTSSHGKPSTVDAASMSWAMVAKNVQAMLVCSAAQTPSERQQLKHVEVRFFTPQVCRERAMYLQWKLQKEAKKKEPAPTAKDKVSGTSAPPSSFDVTKDSLANDIRDLFEVVRQQLPSAVLETSSDDEASEEDSSSGDDAKPVDVDELWKSSKKGGHNSGDKVSALHLQAKNIMNVNVRSDEQVAKEREIASARDAMLTKVQAMQVEFFSKFKRWIDVPLEMTSAVKAAGEEKEEEAAKGRSTSPFASPPTQQHSKKLPSLSQRSAPSTSSSRPTAPSEASEMIEALRQRFRSSASRAHRTSMPNEEEQEEQGVYFRYRPSAGVGEKALGQGLPYPPFPGGDDLDLPPDSPYVLPYKPRQGPVAGEPNEVKLSALPGGGGPRGMGTAGPRVPIAGKNVFTVTKETPAPKLEGRRAERARIIEYED